MVSSFEFPDIKNTIVGFTKHRVIGSLGIQFRSEEITQMFGEVLSDENT